MTLTMTNILRDARIGLRLLGRNPAFAIVAVLTLAVGIAGTTAIFSVVYATFLEPLPYRDPERLAMVWTVQQGERLLPSPRDYVAWKQQAVVFEDLNAWTGTRAALSTAGRTEQVQVGPASPGFLAMLGYGHPLALGRDFLGEDGTPGRDRVVILTHRLWRERFASDPAILGRSIRLNRQAYTVVGVLGPGPADENQVQLWVPLVFTAEQLAGDDNWLLVMARLKPGVTLQEANANLDVVDRTLPGSAGRRVSVEPFRNNFLSRDTKRGLWLLLGAVGFVLLIACANVANLLLARGTARQRELAVRASLGASRAAIVRQLLIEGLVVALAGGAVGVALTSLVLRVVVALMPEYMLPTEAHVRLNVPVLLFTSAACTLCGILCGAAPAWQASRANVNETLKEGHRGLTASGHRLRYALVVTEFALALTLLAGGGLAVRSLLTLSSRDLGIRTDGLLTFWVPSGADRLADPDRVAGFHEQLLERIEALPGVISAAIGTGMPVYGPGGAARVAVAGRPGGDPSQRPYAAFSSVSPSYFDTLGIRLTAGRVFLDRDRAGSVPVAIVNETFVTRFLQGLDPLTARITFDQQTAFDGAAREWQVVGVASDVLPVDPTTDTPAHIYIPFAQSPRPGVHAIVRTAGDPVGVRRAVDDIIQAMDPDVPMADVKTMEQVVSQALVSDRFNTALWGSFAAVGLLLSALGIYGVMSFVVAQRTHEIGLRMALGADRLQIVWRVVREGMTCALVGTAVGTIGAYYIAQTLQGIVTGLTATDPTPVMAVTAALLATALLACVVPALRAVSVEPMAALRRD